MSHIFEWFGEYSQVLLKNHVRIVLLVLFTELFEIFLNSKHIDSSKVTWFFWIHEIHWCKMKLIFILYHSKSFIRIGASMSKRRIQSSRTTCIAFARYRKTNIGGIKDARNRENQRRRPFRRASKWSMMSCRPTPPHELIRKYSAVKRKRLSFSIQTFCRFLISIASEFKTSVLILIIMIQIVYRFHIVFCFTTNRWVKKRTHILISPHRNCI